MHSLTALRAQMKEQRMCYGRPPYAVVQMLVEGCPKPGARPQAKGAPYKDGDFDVVFHVVRDVDYDRDLPDWEARLDAVVRSLMPYAVVNLRGMFPRHARWQDA